MLFGTLKHFVRFCGLAFVLLILMGYLEFFANNNAIIMRALTELINVGLFFVFMAIHIITPVITSIADATIPIDTSKPVTTAIGPAAAATTNTDDNVTTAKITVDSFRIFLLRSTKNATAINPAIANTASKPGNPIVIFFFSPPNLFNRWCCSITAT